MNIQDRQQSEFNDAVGYLGRLNSLFYLADEASITMDMHRWFNCLMAIERELSSEMTDQESDYSTTRINLINPLINKANRELMRTGKMHIENELYMNLHEFDRWLRKIMKSAGLLLRMAEDAGEALI